MKLTIFVFAAVVGCALAADNIKPSIFGGIVCSICESLVPIAEKMIAGDGPAAQKDLDKLCKSLGPFDPECETLVNKYIPMIVKELNSGTGADAVCKEIDLCPKKAKAVAPVLASPLECLLCHAVGKKLEALAGKEEHVIVAELENDFCGHLGGLKGDCDSWIEREGAHIATILSNDEGNDAAELCRKLGMCKKELVEAVKPVQLNPLKKVECVLCKAVVPFAEKEIAGEGPAAEHELEKVCKIVPFFKTECIEVIKGFIDRIIAELNNGGNAETVCVDIDLCPRALLTVEAVKPVELNAVKCYACKAFGPKLEELAAQEEPVVEADLEKICDVFNKWENKIKDECKTWLETEGTQIAAVLTADSGSDAKKLCKDIGWC